MEFKVFLGDNEVGKLDFNENIPIQSWLHYGKNEAIPIEWIKKQLKEEKYRVLLIDHVEWSDCLHWLIDEWEEENAIH